MIFQDRSPPGSFRGFCRGFFLFDPPGRKGSPTRLGLIDVGGVQSRRGWRRMHGSRVSGPQFCNSPPRPLPHHLRLLSERSFPGNMDKWEEFSTSLYQTNRIRSLLGSPSDRCSIRKPPPNYKDVLFSRCFKMTCKMCYYSKKCLKFWKHLEHVSKHLQDVLTISRMF